MVSQFVTTKRLLVATVAGIVLALADVPLLSEGRASGYPITIDVRATPDGDLAMPYNFVVQPGKKVVIRIRNYTRDLHTFAIDGIGVNVAVLPGKAKAPRTTRFTVVFPRYGTYRWFCWTCRLGMHKHHLMEGTVAAWIAPNLEIH